MPAKIPFLDLSRFPKKLQTELKNKFSELLEKGIFSGSEEVEILEAELKKYLGAPFLSVCSNGTDALEIALRALNIGQGDDVIVPALSWVSTAEVVLLCGARPVFIDTNSEGLIDLSLLDQVYTSKTKAIIPVHLYGNLVDMPTLIDWAKIKQVKVIEDAAQAFGAFQGNCSAGLFGDIGCFSFYPTKNFGALGEAGALTCKDEELARKLKALINHGQIKRDHHILVGRNARIDTLQAGFLNTILPYFEPWQKQRKFLAHVYLEELKHLEWLKLPRDIEKSTHNAHLFTVQCRERDQLKSYLEEKGVGTSIHYPRIIPKMKPYLFDQNFTASEQLVSHVLSLPLNPFLSQQEVLHICKLIKNFKLK
ncbi:putative PLP-dependent enzyme possibly involved in cell wall biogenesis [Belliella baltica DSM 15883]|uniref:Putative PLP-dependent enzyme possibly involved in cell wall biogenesis n=1 Tax=Belliella baltica (strain DSM 15883 / CIP 108006 / LMG 21964 / BA134) TaxID=866536 RepID=I3Z8Z0_BELBD|nr:aminotransferase class V-fold PLP-dependent enzyme [Belliella baltica]AFL85708.1 putative PLP-dependent enzyme possibly involved in cell wall biogenesis [Belliella baltica DSM 15883]